jgi:hypothetical protein
MQEINHTDTQKSVFFESVTELQKINKSLSKLLLRKEEVSAQIICALEHNHDGQKTYEYKKWKIEVKTPCVYSLNKNKYESYKNEIPEDFNPVRQSISYSIDKRLCEKYMVEAPKKIRAVLIDLIEKKSGKPTVAIKERV